jgi:hypothetical protein
MVRSYDITFSSPVGESSAAVGPNAGVVTAYLIVPQGPGPFPTVIFGHWCMPGSEKKNRTEFLDEAIILVIQRWIHLTTARPCHRSSWLCGRQHTVERPTDCGGSAAGREPPPRCRPPSRRKDVDPKRLAYVSHSCDGSDGGFLSGIDKRFKAFVIMAGDLSFEIDEKTKSLREYRQKVGANKFDSFAAKHPWMDAGKYVSHAAPAAVFLQCATRTCLNLPASQFVEGYNRPQEP